MVQRADCPGFSALEIACWPGAGLPPRRYGWARSSCRTVALAKGEPPASSSTDRSMIDCFATLVTVPLTVMVDLGPAHFGVMPVIATVTGDRSLSARAARVAVLVGLVLRAGLARLALRAGLAVAAAAGRRGPGRVTTPMAAAAATAKGAFITLASPTDRCLRPDVHEAAPPPAPEHPSGPGRAAAACRECYCGELSARRELRPGRCAGRAVSCVHPSRLPRPPIRLRAGPTLDARARFRTAQRAPAAGCRGAAGRRVTAAGHLAR